MFRCVTQLLLLSALILSGCAYAEVRPLKKDTDVEGIRFYRPWPYLWVMLEKEGGCKFTVEYLPDTSQEYIIIPHTGVGSLKVAPQLTQGWNLTAFDATADSKVAELVSSIAGLAGNIASAAIKPAVATGLGPGLYRFEFGQDGKVSTIVEVFYLVDAVGTRLSCGTALPQQGKKG